MVGPGEEATYIVVAVHAERLDLLDRLHVVVVRLLRRAIGNGGDLVCLLADRPEVLVWRNDIGVIVLVGRRHSAVCPRGKEEK